MRTSRWTCCRPQADWAKYGKEKPVFACGLCGERESHGVNPPKDPDTLVGCFMYFIGAQAVHHCKLVTEEKPYGSHASADKSRWKQELSADGRLRLADWPWPVDRRLRRGVRVRPVDCMHGIAAPA